MTFLKLFGRLKSVVIGMIHVKALPGKTHLKNFFKKWHWPVPSERFSVVEEVFISFAYLK